MDRTIYLQHYRVCLRTDGTPREISRDGAAITYEAADERTREPVDLKLIPLESIDSYVREKLDEKARAAQMLRHVNVAKVYDFGREGGDFVCVSEHLPGETLAAWVAAHGPMPVDAALRVAEQIVSVLSSAGFHRLPYPPIQPSDIIVVPGQTPEGTWPLVKLINFGLPTLGSGAELKSEGSQLREQASCAEHTASPEEVAHETRDIRSEIYSLGATLYFLLTGVALSSEELQRPLKFSNFPKPVRALLSGTLHPDPNQRPKDLVVLAELIRQCLLKIERRRALADKYGIPYRTTMQARTEAPPKRFLRVALPVAALLLAAAVLAAVLLPEPIGKIISRARETKPVGVVIGVPESPPSSAVQDTSTETPKALGSAVTSQTGAVGAPSVSQPSANVATASNRPQVPSPDLQPRTHSTQTSKVQLEPTENPESSPSQTLDTHAAVANSGQVSAAQPDETGETASHIKKRAAPRLQGRAASAHAQMVGITSDGRLIYRLPSGRTRVVAPDSNEGEFAPRRHRRVFIDPDEVFARPPRYAPGYLPDD